MRKKKKPMVDAGRASRLIKKRLTVKDVSNGATGLSPNLLIMKKETKDNPRETRKRVVKSKRLIRNIPREGPSAKEIFRARRK
jgi:hypothetical protein